MKAQTNLTTLKTKGASTLYYTLVESPIDTLLLTSDGAALTGVYMAEHKHGVIIGAGMQRRDDACPFDIARKQLAEYFAGQRQEFDLPLGAVGTDFQKRVWDELTRIPYGGTCSYGELAARIGSPESSRAVGMANGRNPLSIVVPCHRVIGANGKLTGYGGGLGRKEMLLRLEKGLA